MQIHPDETGIPRLYHPLRRLIRQQDAAGLLAPFLKLMPGAIFGMLDQDGNIYAGAEGLNESDLREAWRSARKGILFQDDHLLLRPLIIHNYLAGALLVRADDLRENYQPVLPLIDAVGNGFVRLLEQAVEKRDLGSELLDRYREINLLYRAAETIGSSLDPDSIPRLVLDQILPVVDYDMALVLLPPPQVDENPPDDDPGNFLESAWGGPPDSPHRLRRAAGTVLERVIESGEAVIFTPEWAFSDFEEDQDFPGCVLLAPMHVHGRLLGVLLLGRLPSKEEFSAGDEKLVTALSGQAAIALETARLHQEEVKLQRLEEEMSIGRQIQLSFLPDKLPEIEGWDFAAVYRSARQVGGDLYDVIYSIDRPDRLDLVIADVTGKGVAAALFMAFTRTVLRLSAIEGGSPAQVLRKANHYILQEQRKAVYMSAFFASIDLRTGRVDFSNAGHDWPLLLEHTTGKLRAFEATGYLLGAFDEIEVDEFHSEIAPGDLVVFYTDGVSEAFNPQGELYGNPRLREQIASREWNSAGELLRAILADVERFTQGEPQSDDLTLLVVKRREESKDA